MLRLFRFVFLGLTRRIYRIRTYGAEHLPESGGGLLVANHFTWIDAFLISTLAERQVRFVIAQNFLRIRSISWFIRMCGAIPIDSSKPRDAIRATVQAANDGELVCFFPEGQLSRSGFLTEMRRGIGVVARQLEQGVPILPVYIDGMWGSIFSFDRRRYFFKMPRRSIDPVSITVGPAIDPKNASARYVRQCLQELSVAAFAKRPSLQSPLADSLLRSLKKRPTRPLFIEHTHNKVKPRRKVSRAATIAAAIALAARWRDTLPPADEQRRIGILLPGGAAAVFLNLGLVLAGRVPVNLPFGNDLEALAQTLDRLGIRTVITSRAFAPALKDFPWRCGGNFLDLRAEIDAAGSVRMLLERVRACLEPLWMARRRLARSLDFAVDHKKDDARPSRSEAYGYVCSDPSSDQLQATFLRHDEIVAGVERLHSCAAVDRRGETIFCELSANTAAGSMFALWLPVLSESTSVARSTAARRSDQSIESVVAAENATLLVTSAELTEEILDEEEWHPQIAGHLRRGIDFSPATRCGPDAARTLQTVEQSTGVPICTGWAPDRFGLVASLSLPDSAAEKPTQLEQPGRQPFSVGRWLPGVAHRTDHGNDSETQPSPLRLRVPGEHGAPETVDTGRSARIDDAGFVFLAPDSSD